MFSSEMSTLVKILDTISLIFRFLSISFLIRSLELIAFSPLGYKLLYFSPGADGVHAAEKHAAGGLVSESGHRRQ